MGGTSCTIRLQNVNDRQTGTTECAVISSNGIPLAMMNSGDMSPDGRYFAIPAQWPDAYVPNSTPVLYLRDRQLNTVTKITPPGSEASKLIYQTSVSADGRYVFYRTLVIDGPLSEYTNGKVPGVKKSYIHSLETGADVDADTLLPAGQFNLSAGRLSGDGRFVMMSTGGAGYIVININPLWTPPKP